MELERKSLRVGLWVIACAVLLKLAGILLPAVAAFFAGEESLALLLYLQTGRQVTFTVPEQTQPPETAAPTQPPEEGITFDPADAALLDITNHCGYEPDLEALVTQPLSWNLRSGEPAVLILHTHATESYTPSPGEEYTESAPYRTENTDYNMVSIGAHLASVLEQAGIGVLHDPTLHDGPSYNGSYSYARKTVQAYLEDYPSIVLVLDLHRDASSAANGAQLDTFARVDGASSAQLMMVVGTDAGGLFHPQWQSNLSLAIKLHAALEKQWPGLCRPISFRSERFNQDLSPGALLIEVGGAGDSHADALVAAEALGQAIIALAEGTGS